MQVLKNIPMQPRLIGLLLLVGLIPLAMVSWYSSDRADLALMEQTSKQLISVREIKKNQIETYFKEHKENVEELVNVLTIISKHVFTGMESQRAIRKREVEEFFRDRSREVSLLSSNVEVATALESIGQAFHNDHNRWGSPAWEAAVKKQGSWLTQLQKEYGYADVFLIDKDGNVVFTAKRESDLGENVVTGPLRGSGLGQLFQKAKEGVIIEDFSPYAPFNHGQASFIGTPVKRDGKIIGTLAFQIPVTPFNRIMHNRFGLSETGETYLVGPAGTYRSDRINQGGKVGEGKMDSHIQKALTGESGTTLRMRGFNKMELVSYSPVTVAGLQWAIIVTQPAEDAFVSSLTGKKDDYFSQFIHQYGFSDLGLISPDGFLFYNIASESDSETNLVDGKYSQTNHGRLIRQVLRNKEMGMVDFEPYPPSNNKPCSFIAMPIVSDGKLEFVVTLELSLEPINAIMQNREGMGKTGESYLVGPDKLMRSDSFEDPVGHSVKASFAGTVTSNGADIEAARRALAGESGVRETLDYQHSTVLSAYTPVKAGNFTWALLADIELQEVHEPIQRLTNAILLISLVLVGFVIGIALLTARTIANPLRMLMSAVNTIAGGDWSARAEVVGTDELGQLAISFNHMAQNNEDQFWVKSKSAEFATIVQKSTSPDMFAQEVICKLTPLMEGGHGALYVLNELTKRYQLLGTYAYKERKHLSNEFALGMGLVGQCALEKQPILQTQVPGDYVQINSGLGEANPLSLLVIPLIFQDQVLAVIEVASFHRFTPVQRALLDELSPVLGLSLENQNRTRRTQELLEETRAQAQEMTTLAEELQAQQEELNQSNQILAQKNMALQTSEEEMRMQQEEIQANNKVLEDRTRQLEIQKEALELSQQEIEEKAAELAQASKYKSEFLANMSHELRNPLNSLLILAKQLSNNEEGNLTESQVKSAQIVHRSGQDLLFLINDILDLAKIESGKLDVHIEMVNVRRFAEQIDQLFSHSAANKGIALKVEVAQESPDQVRTDSVKLGQIIKNLVSNAIKFTETGTVTVRFHPMVDECFLAVSVIDTGIGIPVNKLDLIFEAFQQADGTTTRRFGGTGLGLSISKELATLLGGDIRVQSTEGKGSTFTLCLTNGKLTELPPSGKKSTPPPASLVTIAMDVKDDREGVSSKDRTILVVDDDPILAEILCGLAHKKGFKCLIASDGAMGLELASRYQPHGIILDIALPGHLDGMMVMDRLKANPATVDIPVHMISGTDKSKEGLAKGAVSFLLKPVTQEQLDGVFHEVALGADMEGRVILIVESDGLALQTLLELVRTKTTHITTASSGEEAFSLLQQNAFDCMILNPELPDLSGCDLLDRIHLEAGTTKPRVIIYTDKKLSREEDAKLRFYTDSIVVKSARSEKRLLEEVELFLHAVESSQVRQLRQLSRVAQDKEAIFAGKKILIVDDDMRNTYALASALGARGLETEIADNGVWALKKLEEHPDINVVLMDIMMPEMDGYQAMAAIRKQKRFKQLPIIALTAKAMAEDRAKCLQSGANDYLPKPIEMERLFSLLRVWLNG